MNTETMRERADEMVRIAKRLDEIAAEFDVSGAECKCCGGFRYKNFSQRNQRERVKGAAERLTEIANYLHRRAEDPDFLNGPKPKEAANAV